MKRSYKSILAAAVLAVASCAYGFSLPKVGTGTALNTWSSNMSGILGAAQQTGYPIFLVMINDSSAGDGCGHCKLFVERTLNTAEFDAIVRDYKFYMVLLNIWGADTSSSQPEYGGVSSSVFMNYFSKYNVDGGYPIVAVLSPDGKKYAAWGDSTVPSTRGTSLHQYIRQAIADFAPSSTEISLSSQSGNVVTVQADPSSPAMMPGVWTGVVTRSGGSGTTGMVSIWLSGDAASRYALSESALQWDASDGSRAFTVTGPSPLDGSVVADTVTVSISASGFDGSDISYGTTSQTVTFKDTRVKSTLAEFAAANAGLGGLSSSGGVWFVPSQDDGNLLETFTSVESTLVFNATVGGILTVEAGPQRAGEIIATDAIGEIQLANGRPVRFGVAPGQVIVFKATAVAGVANLPIGFAQFSFAPLPVTLSAPAANAQISYDALLGDKSLVNLAWSAGFPGCTFSLACNDAVLDMGTATSGNAVDLGFVSLAPETRTYVWSVSAAYYEDGLRGTAVGTALSSFTVESLPSYEGVPSTVVAYKSIGALIDMSVGSVGGGSVTYSATGLPRGMKIDAATGIITGKPTVAKKHSVTVTASNPYGSTPATFTLSVEKFPKAYSKPKYALFYFNGDDAISASAQMSVAASGKWSAKVLEGGRTTKLNGSVTALGDGSIAIMGASLNLTYDQASGIWSGACADGRRVYGKARDKASAMWKGTWNIGFVSSSAANIGGWASAKVKGSGDISFTGSVSGTTKVSGGGYSAEFPDWFVVAYLPRWAGHGSVRFGHTSLKTGVNIGCALYADGMLGGNVSHGAQGFDLVEGSYWSKAAIAKLNGSVFRTIGGGDVAIPVVASGSKISAGENGYGAQLSCAAKGGTVSATYKLNGKTFKATGVVYEVGGRAKAAGGGMQGVDTFGFTIE